MGAFKSKPKDAKETRNAENKNFKAAVSCMQGWPKIMADAHCMQLTMPAKPDTGFFCVFDGHRGTLVAQIVSSSLLQRLERDKYYATNESEALRRGFMRLDDDLRAQPNIVNSGAGSTALAVLIDKKVITCANLGDSRAIVSVNGRAVRLSNEHRPDNREERTRITAAGGFVHANRVSGVLPVSRAFGDFDYKYVNTIGKDAQQVIALPEIITIDITPDHEFVFIATDGIWAVMNTQAVVDFIRPRLIKGRNPSEVLEAMLAYCLAKNKHDAVGTDNMTAILVCILQDQPYATFVQNLKKS